MLSIIALLLAGASPTVSRPMIDCKMLCSVTHGRFTFLVAPRWLALIHIDGVAGESFTLRLVKSQQDFEIGRAFSGRLSQPVVAEHNPKRFTKVRGRFALEDIMPDLEKAPAIYIDDCGYQPQSDPNTIVTNSFCVENLHGIGAAIASARKQMATKGSLMPSSPPK